MDPPKLTVPDLPGRKATGDKLVMITCYDATFARLLEEAGVDMLLVGDSLGMVVQGQATTMPGHARRDDLPLPHGQPGRFARPRDR